jgi:L,D-peptidoglycan transpeptidase YkuD (ErfK/YbiS/YcfS/YnhG family)
MENEALAQSRQLLLVIAPDAQSTKGRLWRFERAQLGAEWVVVDQTEISLGRNGLGWGKGFVAQPISPIPTKHEGDGKAPAGIFALDAAFGHDSAEENHVRDYPYTQITHDLVGVDDPKSAHYNSLVKESEVAKRDWDSAEQMARPDGLYQFGVVVKHNWKPGAQPDAYGSCIFLHVWKEPGWPTSGCTAMAAPKVAEILRWLRESKLPRLVQLTRSDYEAARAGWGLPAI